jgi:hypothetical protein
MLSASFIARAKDSFLATAFHVAGAGSLPTRAPNVPEPRS